MVGTCIMNMLERETVESKMMTSWITTKCMENKACCSTEGTPSSIERKCNAFSTGSRAPLRPVVPRGLPNKTSYHLFSAQLFRILWMSSLTSQGYLVFISCGDKRRSSPGSLPPQCCTSSALTLLFTLSLGCCFCFFQLWALDLGSPVAVPAGSPVTDLSWLWKLKEGGIGLNPHSSPLGRWLSCQ